MKKLLSAIVVMTLLLFVGTAIADPIYYLEDATTEVGYADAIKASTTLLDSSAAGELAWVQSILGSSFTVAYLAGYDSFDWLPTKVSPTFVSAPLVWALPLPTPTDYYFIKIGTGGTLLTNDHILYTNLASKDYAVIDISSWPGYDASAKNINIYRVSHVGMATPIPAAAWLLGSGLIGLVAVRRRFTKK